MVFLLLADSNLQIGLTSTKFKLVLPSNLTYINQPSLLGFGNYTISKFLGTTNSLLTRLLSKMHFDKEVILGRIKREDLYGLILSIKAINLVSLFKVHTSI